MQKLRPLTPSCHLLASHLRYVCPMSGQPLGTAPSCEPQRNDLRHAKCKWLVTEVYGWLSGRNIFSEKETKFAKIELRMPGFCGGKKIGERQWEQEKVPEGPSSPWAVLFSCCGPPQREVLMNR